jgi:signal peptidase I
MALLQFLQKWILPVRYRSSDTTTTFYTRQHALAVVWRFPLWLLLAAMLSWDERINPYNIIRITGPSMIPTCAPDGTDIWLKVSWNKTLWFRLLHHLFPSVFKMSYQSGDLIGLSHPDHPHHVSCKRVIGVEGDTVQRYGQYVHLFEDQDPQHLGMTWPSAKEQVHAWIDRQCLWDTGNKTDDVAVAPDSRRTLVVPEKSLWVEGDCPGLAIDSRQYGPIPLDWIQGKLVGRIWPFWRKESGELPRRTRPHPVALDDETLQQFNVHIRPSTTS